MDKKFILEYLDTPSPVMYETRGQALWAETLRPYVDEVSSDNYGNICGLIKSRNRDNYDLPFSVMLDAHADEISYIVNEISDNGLIHPIKNGGSDIQLALSKDVIILSKDSFGNPVEIDGYFGWLPIHHKDKDHENIKPERKNIFIDIGCSTKEEVLAKGIKIGDPIIYNVKARFINKKNIVGKSLDDKIGGIINLEVAKLLKQNQIELPYDLYIVNSVQEEVGAFGAQIAVKQIKPDIALVFDAFFDATNPLFDDSKKLIGSTAKLGDGVIIMNGSCVQKNLRQLIINAAIENDVKHTLGHSTGFGGTNADRIFTDNIVTALLSIPLKYMHTTVETVCIDDVQEAINLLFFALQKIEYMHDFRYHRF